jgi:SAM-dependent methyltransferase
MPHITDRPEPFSAYTTPEFWDDDHISAQMLTYHLDPVSYPASRPHAFIGASASWLVEALDLAPHDTLLDLGCGPGLYSTRLARLGIHVTGVDVSRRSLAHAREVALHEQLPADFRRANYLTDELGGPYDAAILVYEDYCALSPEQRVGLLRRTHDALRPGGRFAMDVTAAPRFAEAVPGVTHGPDLDDGFWAVTPYEGMLETFTYPELRLVLNRYTIVGAGVTRQYWNWMACLTPDEVVDELAAADFGPPSVYGDVTGAPYDPASPMFAVVTART